MGPTFRIFEDSSSSLQLPPREPKTPAPETEVFQRAVSPEPTPSPEVVLKISVIVGDPESLENLVEFGDHQFSQNNFTEALTYYESANEKYLETPHVLSRLGVVHYNLNEFEKAIAYFSEYLALKESNQVLAFRAKCSFLLGEKEKNIGYITSAIDDFEKVHKALPEEQETKEALGSAYAALADFYRSDEVDRAITLYTQAIEMDRTQSDYFVNRGRLYSQKKKEDFALEDFQSASTAESHVLQAKIYSRRKDPLRALEGFKKARNLQPNCQRIARLYRAALAEKAAHCVRGFR